MFNNFLCSCCSSDSVLYDLYSFRGHVFRKYPDGHITQADENDVSALIRLGCKF